MNTVDSNNQWLWQPAELALTGAFQWETLRPHVGDPGPLLRFLKHCLLQEQEKRIVMDGPVERIMLALAGAPAEVISDGLAGVDFTQPLFFNGICHALRNGAPHLLRRATITFLRHLDAQLFDNNKTFSVDQVNAFIPGWSSSAQESLGKEHGELLKESLFATLMGLLDSAFWREHIPQDRWDILVLLGGMAEERIPPSFYRCVRNSTIIPYLKKVDPRSKNTLAQWAAILWAKYPDLAEEVRLQVGKATDEMRNGQSKQNIPLYQTIVEGQIKRIQDNIRSHSWPFGEDVAELRKRLDLFQTALGTLVCMQKLPIPAQLPI